MYDAHCFRRNLPGTEVGPLAVKNIDMDRVYGYHCLPKKYSVSSSITTMSHHRGSGSLKAI